MKKALLFLVSVVFLVGCGSVDKDLSAKYNIPESSESTSKAMKLATDYVKNNANDSKAKIISHSYIESYTYTEEEDTYWKEDIEKLKADNAFLETLETAKMEGTMAYTTLNENNEKIKELEEKIANYQPKTHHLKRMAIKVRGKNALGAEVLDDFVLFFDDEVTKCAPSALGVM